MKKNVLIILISLTACIGTAQEWFTSFDVAKRMALVQNKMLFVVWEASFEGQIPVLVKSDNGQTIVIDLANDTTLDSVIREYFVPVRLPESEYVDFMKEAEERGYRYVNKLTDNSIKIMDVNGTIINTEPSIDVIEDFSELIETYALNTSFLNNELRNYMNDSSYLTAYLLGEKYVEYAIFSKKDLRDELIDLANIYLNESEKLLSNSTIETSAAILQKIELTRIEQYLLLDRAGKARRELERLHPDEIAPVNERFYAFLRYTIFKLREDDANAEIWKPKISSLDLKKSEMILNTLHF